MKIQYASDLHLEFDSNAKLVNSEGFMPLVGDVLLLAGDIIYLEDPNMESDPFFDWCADNFEQTVIVPGNHEYYMGMIRRDGHRDGVPLENTLDGYERKIRPNVRYLNNKSIILGDTEVFATTLWTVTDPNSYVSIQTCMNDCCQILYNHHRLWAYEYTEVHNICRGWLDRALRESTAKHKVVLTHHCPTARKDFDTHKFGSGIYSAFHVDMEPFISEHDIDCWIYGHTHLKMGSGTVLPSKGKGTTLLCNQLGYVSCDEHRDFNPECFVEL